MTLRRSPMKRPAYARPPVVLTPIERCGVYAPAVGSAPIPKPVTYRSEKHLARVRKLPCVDCGRVGETQAAHMNFGKSLALKASDGAVCALCVTCHRRLDQGGQMTKAERRAYEWEMVAKTYIALQEQEA